VDAARLEAFPLLAGLPAGERENLASVFVEERVEAGRTLARSGDFGYALYALEVGEAEVADPDGIVLRHLHPGDTFGEIALVLAGRRSATVTATTDMVVLSLFARDFLRIRESVPAFEAALRELGAERLGS
jgi:voltage-gated potassium channel